MEKLAVQDFELIQVAQEAIKGKYDGIGFLHTVGAALRTKQGRIYRGINVYSIHGACAEQVALGAAMTNGEKDFECIVAVEGESGENILSPCGNCRQILSDYAPDCFVILKGKEGFFKVKAKDLLPYPYETNY